MVHLWNDFDGLLHRQKADDTKINLGYFLD